MNHAAVFLLIFLVAPLSGAIAPSGQSIVSSHTLHSGGTDKCGCHYNRKTGEYHCHTRKQRGGDCPA